MNELSDILKLGRRVRRRRRALRLTQAELSRLAGCGELFVRQLEKGKRTLRLDKLLDVLAVLGLGFELVDSSTPLQVSDA